MTHGYIILMSGNVKAEVSNILLILGWVSHLKLLYCFTVFLNIQEVDAERNIKHYFY